MFGFFEKKAKLVVSHAEAPSAEVVDCDDVDDLRQLPAFEKLLTLPDGDIPLGESQRGMLAAIRLSKTSAVILAKRSALNSNEHLSLLQRARQQYSLVSTLPVRSSLLLTLYTQESKGIRLRSERVQGEEALARATFIEMAERGVRERASDLHVEISEETGSAELRYRMDGKLRLLDTIPALHALEAVGFAYTKLAEKSSRSEPSFNRRLLQACAIPLTVEGDEYTLRWQSTPKVGGLDVVFRILETRANSSVTTLPELGFSPDQCKLLTLLVRSKGGIVVVGETGSGKSTTLRTLQALYPNREQKKIISLEQPVEYRKAGVTEISVQPAAAGKADPFVEAMRASLRMDPDLILPGEIRDRETASLFKAMVQGGHKVITTLHTGSAVEAIHRLASEEIGVSRQVLGSRDFLSGIIYQKLLALLCSHCKLPALPMLDDGMVQALTNNFGLDVTAMYVANPNGCAHCRHTGHIGRTVVAEILPVNREMLALIRDGRDGEIEDRWRELRTAGFGEPNMAGKTAFEHGLYKVHEGLIDPFELAEELSVAYELYEVYQPRRAKVAA